MKSALVESVAVLVGGRGDAVLARDCGVASREEEAALTPIRGDGVLRLLSDEDVVAGSNEPI